ncbi:unnamed protein product [Camellia sinensis]
MPSLFVSRSALSPSVFFLSIGAHSPPRRFVGHSKDVLSIAFSFDNRQIVSASRDRSIKLWNTLGECKYTIEDGDAHSDWVSCVRFSPNNLQPTIMSSSWDRTVKFWNLTNCKIRASLAGHSGYVNTVAVSPDGSLCASGGKDGVILLWNLAEGKKLYSLDSGSIINALCFSPNRYWLCAATEASIKIWDLESMTIVVDLKVDAKQEAEMNEGGAAMSSGVKNKAKADLWKISGHLDFYKENMYDQMKIEEELYQLRPMNCPYHILVYKRKLHSYRDFPIRVAELGTVYRYELSGSLHGLFRVRGFTQDDAHIFCLDDQIKDEIRGVLDLTEEILLQFGFSKYEVNLSTRPEKAVGGDDIWEKTTFALKDALDDKRWSYQVDEGGGAFYGPKIDLKIEDALGRKWQCSTIQVDFNLPQRFDITYVDSNSKKKRPIMIHRAVLGSLERFFGVLIEHYAGDFPLWLCPIQARVLPVTDTQWRSCVDSMNRPGILLEVVQILTDLDLTITKAYISSDGGWFMDVFHKRTQGLHQRWLEELARKECESAFTDYREHNDDTTVHFEVIMSEENLIMAKQEGLLKKFKLTTTISTSNMHLFDPKGVIKKYETPEQILEEFFHVRLEFYEKRKRFTALIICHKEVIQLMTLWNAFKDEFENEKNMLGGSLGQSSTRLILGEKNMLGEKNDQAQG